MISIREWIVLSLLIGCVAMICATSLCRGYYTNLLLEKAPIEVLSKEICIEISGGIKRPGSYRVERGCTLRKLLKKARLKRQANLDGLELNVPLENSCKVLVPVREYFEIFVSGEVLISGRYRIPVNTRFFELKKILPLKKNADPKIWKSKRLLKHLEIIEIPPRGERK